MFATLLRLSAGIALVSGLLASVLLTVASVADVSRLGLGKLGSISGIGPFLQASNMAGSGAVLLALFVGLACVVLYLVLTAAGDLISLLLDIEENTRSAAYFVGPKP